MIREEEPPKPSTRLSDSARRWPSIAAQRHTEPAKLTKLVRGELDWIVMKALEKDRNRRYETANGFAADVQRYLADEPVQACPPSAGYRFRKFARRNKAAVGDGGDCRRVLLVVGTAVSTWQAVRATSAERLAVQQRDDSWRTGPTAEARQRPGVGRAQKAAEKRPQTGRIRARPSRSRPRSRLPQTWARPARRWT